MSEYADRDIVRQGAHYTRHVSAMTEEDLHSKSDIAAELAHRDVVIEQLRQANEKLERMRSELIKENNILQQKVTDLRRIKFADFADDECWIYQEGEDNRLGGLVCPVVISAETLEQIERDKAELVEVLSNGRDAIEILVAARKMRTHCKDWSAKEVIDELIALHSKYRKPGIDTLLKKHGASHDTQQGGE